MNHWIGCNVYPQTQKWAQKQLKEHFLKFKYLKNYPKMKKNDPFWRLQYICYKLQQII